ncbi:MAG: Ig-like domain-containing protein [Candidatus Gracilibacteria bacterium]|jgi:hypothetical protein
MKHLLKTIAVLAIIILGLFSATTLAFDNPAQTAIPSNVSAVNIVSTVTTGQVSKSGSEVSPENQVVSIFGEKAYVTVTLVDDYGNFVSGHSVRLISSTIGDVIENTTSEVTDSNGQTVFRVSSRQVGAVVYTAYDVTADVILDSKSRIAYFDDSDYVLTNNIPSNYSYAANASGNASGAVSKLSFEEVPEVINPGQNISFKLTAYDAADQVVVNYGGTVHFSVESGSQNYVTLPTNYTFIPQDLGSHTFSVALGFQQAGSYQLRAQDMGNNSVFGQFIFGVGNWNQQAGSITITNPISGNNNNNTQVITGVANPGAKLKIFDGEIELTSMVADLSGIFSFTTGVLADGTHRFTVAEVNDVGTILSTSPVVVVNINTTGVTISNVVVDPSTNVEAGSPITVKIYASGILSEASLLLANNTYPMAIDPTGFYSVQVSVPNEFGQYPLSFIVKDEVGNETMISNRLTLTVSGQTTLPEFVGDVSNVTASTDDRRVVLNWDVVTESTNPIQNYRVYIGSTPTELTTAIDTFTNVTTWYIPNLENGTEYNFAVVAVDTKGNISAHFSNIISATPNPLVIETTDPEVDLGLGGTGDLDHMKEDASKSGPEILWLVLVSALGGICYSETARRRKL